MEKIYEIIKNEIITTFNPNNYNEYDDFACDIYNFIEEKIKDIDDEVVMQHMYEMEYYVGMFLQNFTMNINSPQEFSYADLVREGMYNYIDEQLNNNQIITQLYNK